MKVSVAEAKNTLPRLIKAVEDGESVTIYRHGTPVVDIVRTTKADPEKPRFGTLTGKVTALDPGWGEPTAHDDVDAFLDGRCRVRLLLDTVTFIWAASAPERLSRAAMSALRKSTA